jgi:iron complex transport system ATP-binding protein
MELTRSMDVDLGVEGLSFGYGSTLVLNALSVAPLRAGEVTAVVGPNAAGKSTLLKCIAGLLPATGRIMLRGQEVRSAEQRRALRQQVTYLPQEYASTAALTVFEAVLVARQQSASWIVGEAELGQVASILEELRLDHLALRYLNELSGGQRQMVAVAQSLARDPRVLLLDEPTSSLDLQRQLELLELVRKLAGERRMTVLIALHDLNLAARFADRLVMLNSGTVYADGSPAETLTELALWHVYGVEARVEHDADGIAHVTPLRSVRHWPKGGAPESRLAAEPALTPNHPTMEPLGFAASPRPLSRKRARGLVRSASSRGGQAGA